LSLRRFVDAVAKTSGSSLNDLLVPGPDLIKLLPSVLYKFREKSIAQAAKSKTAETFNSIYPDTSKAVKENFYVDDYLDSLDSVPEAIKRWERDSGDHVLWELRPTWSPLELIRVS